MAGDCEMARIAKRASLILVTLCLVALPFSLAPAAALAQGAEEEYDLDLPTNGGQSTPNHVTTSNSDDGTDFPVLVIVIVVAAGVGVGTALWRLRTRQLYDDEDEDNSPE